MPTARSRRARMARSTPAEASSSAPTNGIRVAQQECIAAMLQGYYRMNTAHRHVSGVARHNRAATQVAATGTGCMRGKAAEALKKLPVYRWNVDKPGTEWLKDL